MLSPSVVLLLLKLLVLFELVSESLSEGAADVRRMGSGLEPGTDSADGASGSLSEAEEAAVWSPSCSADPKFMSSSAQRPIHTLVSILSVLRLHRKKITPANCGPDSSLTRLSLSLTVRSQTLRE